MERKIHADLNTEVKDPERARWTRMAALVIGIAFLVVGVAGFIPGLTTNYDTLQFAGHDSEAQLFGVFQVSILHNIVHLLFGVVGLLASRKSAVAVWYLILGGTVYFFLWLFGIGVDEHADANFVPLDDADNWLHLVLAIVMVGLGVWGLRALNDQSHLHQGPGQ